MYNMTLQNRIISKILLVIIVGGCLWSGAYKYADEIIQATAETVSNTNEIIQTVIQNKENTNKTIPSYEETTKNFLDSLPFKQMMIDVNGHIAKNLNMRELYQKSGGVVLSNGYVAGIYPSTSTDYEFQQTLELKNFLDERGIQLLYVNEPTKYFDDTIIQTDLGKETYVNANTDLFLSRLEDAGIDYIDLRDTYTQMGLDSFNLFYKTDHHWTVPAGKIAAEAIASALNEKCGYHIDLTLYDAEKFSTTHFDNAWLGEQGKKIGASFIGMDDFDLILPNYNTDYTVTYGNGNIYSGTFDETFVSQGIYSPELNRDIYNAPSWHYSYMSGGIYQSTILNNATCDRKKILVLGDSYEQVTIPFLSLGIAEIQTLILRSYEGSLREFINAHEIDTVVIAYASFMIGAHDNEASANYTMFTFE